MAWRHTVTSLCVVAALMSGVTHTKSTDGHPVADYLLVGSYHMSNPGRDLQNMTADDVLGVKRQQEIADVARLLERYQPTKIMVEVDSARQATLQENFVAFCAGQRALSRSESEQLGFRIACARGLDNVYAVDWNGQGPITDKARIDYAAAVETYGQQEEYAAFQATLKAQIEKDQRLLDNGTVVEALRHFNGAQWLNWNASTYHRLGLLGTQEDPVGANWVQSWYGRNLMIFNAIARATNAGDRVLVIYGAGHGNLLRQLAQDSGFYRIHDPVPWLSDTGPVVSP